MERADPALVARVIAGDRAAINRLIDALTPVVQARIARILLRIGHGQARDIREEVADHVQDVLLHLFADDAQALGAWEPERGLSLANYAGLIAERRTISALRSGRRNPWRESPGLDERPETASKMAGPETRIVGRDLLDRLLDAMKADLSPLGWHLFELIYIDERSVDEIGRVTGLKPDAVYAWRSRLRKTARRLRERLEGDAERQRES